MPPLYYGFIFICRGMQGSLGVCEIRNAGDFLVDNINSTSAHRATAGTASSISPASHASASHSVRCRTMTVPMCTAFRVDRYRSSGCQLSDPGSERAGMHSAARFGQRLQSYGQVVPQRQVYVFSHTKDVAPRYGRRRRRQCCCTWSLSPGCITGTLLAAEVIAITESQSGAADERCR